MRYGKGHQRVGGRTILCRQLEEMYVRLSLGIFLTFGFALLSAMSGVDDNDWNWRMLETISTINRVIEGLTSTSNQEGDRLWRRRDLESPRSRNPANTFGSTSGMTRGGEYESMDLILKATNDELHYHIKLEDQTMTTRALPLCPLYSELLRCQSSVLPRAGIPSLRLSLPLLVVIFPLHVSNVSDANASIGVTSSSQRKVPASTTLRMTIWSLSSNSSLIPHSKAYCE